MKLFRTIVKRPIGTIMAIIFGVILGLISLTKLPVDLFPKVEVPYLYVSTYYEDVGPKEMDTMVTGPIEEALATMSNLKKIESSTSEGSSDVFVELSLGTDVDFAAMEAREKIDDIRNQLPKAISKPSIFKFNPNDTAIMEIGVLQDGSVTEGLIFIKKKIKPRLERLEGVGSVSISGGKEEEIIIDIDDAKLVGFGITASDIQSQLVKQNIDVPSGNITTGNKKIVIRTIGKFKELENLRDFMIHLPSGEVLPLEAIATVEKGFKDYKSEASANGKEWVSFSIKKSSGANIVAVGKRVNEELKKIEEEYKDKRFKTISDQSKIITGLINNIKKSILVGSILAIAILYLFLSDIRSTIIIGLSLPIAVIMTFFMMYMSCVSINVMTLGGLALGIGMLVDNSIVVLENIHRHMSEGDNPIESAIAGVSEVSLSVMASTLTTIVVFLPIIFLKGYIAKILNDLALAVTYSLSASLLVAVTLVPVLAVVLLKKKAKAGKTPMYKLSLLFNKGYERFKNMYAKKLKWGLANKGKVITISVLVFVLSIVSVFYVGMELFPATDDGYINASIRLPSGSKLDQTKKIMDQIEASIQSLEEVDTVYQVVGSDGYFTESENIGYMTIELHPLNERSRSKYDVAGDIRWMNKDLAGVKIDLDTTSAVDNVSDKEQFSLMITGESLSVLSSISDELIPLLKKVDGLENLKANVMKGSEELTILPDTFKMSRYKISTGYIGAAIQDSIMGQKASKLKGNGKEIDIRLTGEKSYTESIESLKSMNIIMDSGVAIPLDSLTRLTVEKGPATINKENKRIIGRIKGSIEGRVLSDVVKDVEAIIADYHLPDGYDLKVAGQAEEMDESFRELGMVLVVAVLLVYMILTAQFESLLKPMIIMLSVPLAFSGGLLGLFVFGKSLNIPAIIGCIVLSGVVVNDAILLIDYITIRMAQGESRHEAILKAGPIRLRPILMTTLTTVLALVPMLIVKKAATLAPMAAVVCGGLLLSDLLLLIFVPVMYDILDGIRERQVKKSKGEVRLS